MNRRAAHDSRTDAAWLTDALRQQAGQHEADSRRIEARFARLTATAAEPARARSRRFVRLTRLTRLRLIGVPLGVLAVAATATVAVGVSLGITARTPHQPSQAAPPSSPRATATGHQPIPQSTPSPQRPAGTASPHTESSPTARSGPTGPLAAAGTIDSHSNPYWAQADLTVTTTRAIHALHAVVTVSGGASVQSTGSWATLPATAITVATKQTAGGLVYDITLKPGQTLQPGAYTFGLQFDHPAAGHNFALDAYTVTSDAAQASATGTFAN